MFFSIGKKQDLRFTEHKQLGVWWFSHDSGWSQHENTWYKGYNHASIDHGNYCQITLENNRIDITHDRYRSFPLWWNEQQSLLTNLLGSGKIIWANEHVWLTPDGIGTEKINIYGEINNDVLSLDQVLYTLEKNLQGKFQALKKDYPAVKKSLFVSGGTDTLILLALARQHCLDIDILDYDHIEYNQFMDLNFSAIKNAHWGYGQIHHWRKPSMLITGGCGDEFLFRGPYTIGLWAAWHDIDVASLINQSTGYHVEYFKLPKNQQAFDKFWNNRHELQDTYPDKTSLIQQILDINANDHQHWHLGNTLTWTPFKDLELTKTILRLSAEDLIQHVIDATVSRELIKKFDSSCHDLLSTTKNEIPRQNLYQLFNYG